MWCLGSYLVVAALTLVLRLSSAVALVAIGAAAAGLYYWFAAAAIGAAFELPASVPVIRTMAFVLVAVWAMKALPETRRAVAASAGH